MHWQQQQSLSDAIDGVALSSNSCTPAVYASLLQQCGKAQALDEGRRLHSIIVSSGHAHDRYLQNLLVQMYGKCHSVSEACTVFRSIRRRNVFSWNIMLAAYAENGHLENSRQIFDSMPERDSVSWNEMIGALAKNGCLQEAKVCFDLMPSKDVVSWTLIVAAYTDIGHFLKAIALFRMMDLEGVAPDRVMFVIALDACASAEALETGRIIHSCLLDRGGRDCENLVVLATLVNLYGKCRAVDDAQRVFDRWRAEQRALPRARDEAAAIVTLWNAIIAALAQNARIAAAERHFLAMPARDVVSWNTMIAAFAQNEMEHRAVRTLAAMDLEGVPPNEITLIAAIDACSKLADRVDADRAALPELLHCIAQQCGLERDVRIGNALLHMYGQYRAVPRVEEVFHGMPRRNVVTWSALISAYSHNRRWRRALAAYRGMLLEGERPNEVTLLCAVDAAAGAATAQDAAAVHRHICECGAALERDPVMGNAIVNMYGKCGSLDAAMAAFAAIPMKSVVSWNTIIGALAHSGRSDRALETFRAMLLDGGASPNEGCFTSVLATCNHAGLLSRGLEHFASMAPDFGVAPVTEHFHCVIDLLGRAGRLAEVEELMASMPCKPDVIAWTAFVDACKTHGEFRRGDRAGDVIVDALEPGNSGPYTLLSNLYVECT